MRKAHVNYTVKRLNGGNVYWTMRNWGLSADRFLTEKIYQSEMFSFFYFLMDFHYLNTIFFFIHSTFSPCFQI